MISDRHSVTSLVKKMILRYRKTAILRLMGPQRAELSELSETPLTIISSPSR
jgi:hypothetical protein